MPIKGLTDQPKQFKEIGQIRKGAPKPKDKKQPGADLTYFRPTFEEGEDKAAAMFREIYGDEPREINIRLPFNTVDENFDAWQEAYVQSGLIHRCDGEYVQYEVDPQTGEALVMDGLDVNSEQVKCDGSADCKPTGRLKVIVPELRRLAFMTVLTTSVWDILNISRQLEAIRYMNGGKLQKVPLVLTRRPREISTPSGKGGKKARREKWLLGIEADPDWVEAQILRLPAIEEPLQLPPGVPDTNGHEEEPIEGEYEIQEGGKVWEDERPVYEEDLPFTDEDKGPVWKGQYPTTMAKVKEWAEKEPYCFDNGDIRSAIVKRLVDEFGDPTPTPEDFKKEVGEEEAATWFWEAIVMEYELRQAPEQASQGRKSQTGKLVTRSVQAPCAWFDPVGRDPGLFGPAAASTWWNRCVSTARFVESQMRCILNQVEGSAVESLFTRFLDEASQCS